MAVAGAILIVIGLGNRSSMIDENKTMNDNKEWANSLYGMGYDRVEVDLTSVWVMVGVGIFLIVAALFVFLLYGRNAVVVQTARLPHPTLVPGWYDDPDSPLLLRYWDGLVWTEKTASKQGLGDTASHPSTVGVHGAKGVVRVPRTDMGPRDISQGSEDAPTPPVPVSAEAAADTRLSGIDVGDVVSDPVATAPRITGARGKRTLLGLAGLVVVGSLIVFATRTGSPSGSVSGPTPTVTTATDDFKAFFTSLRPNERTNICDRFTLDSDQAVAFVKAPLGGLGWEPYVIKSVLYPECGLVQRGGSGGGPEAATSPTPAATAGSRPSPAVATLSSPASTAATATEGVKAFLMSLRPNERRNICSIFAGDSDQAVVFINSAVGGIGWEPYVIKIVLFTQCGSLSKNDNYNQA
jgi:hypothetical protein